MRVLGITGVINGEVEVAELGSPGLVKQHIRCLDVSVDHAMLSQTGQGLSNVLSDAHFQRPGEVQLQRFSHSSLFVSGITIAATAKQKAEYPLSVYALLAGKTA